MNAWVINAPLRTLRGAILVGQEQMSAAMERSGQQLRAHVATLSAGWIAGDWQLPLFRAGAQG
jgi:hypothetical protein